ncbi:MAG: DUF6516 family protein [Cyanobacteria bacterium LVE1205-1]|jgi:hypothetical protein
MSPKILQDYFNQIEQLLRNFTNTYVEEFKINSLTSERANLRLKVRFAFKYLLAVSEIIVVVDNQISYIDYRYHFQDAQNNLIFRYDSTPHFPELHSFPHHKHLPDQVIACKKPHLAEVLTEAEELLE